jgi:outer membrane protein assembly factor BamB
MSIANWTKRTVLCALLMMSASFAFAQDWPQWRGPNRDNHVTGFTPPKTWPKELTQKWKITVGLGESCPVLVGNKLYVFSRQAGDEVIHCLDAATGKEIWTDKYEAVAVKGAASPHPGPRSTPAVGEGKICTLGVGGVVSCLDAASGKLMWRKDTKSWPQFYTSSSPIIVDGKCIVYVGAGTDAALTAFDLTNGETKWAWKGGGAPYGSPVLMTVERTRQVVTPKLVSKTEGVVAGVNLADGALLWEIKVAGNYDNTMGTPVIDGSTVYYSGPNNGIVAIKIDREGNGFLAKELWKKPPAAHKYNTPVLKNGMLFGMTGKRNFFCMDAKTGESFWPDDKSDKNQHGECCTILDAGTVLVAGGSDGKLAVMEPSGKAYKELATYTVSDRSGLDGPWAGPIIAGNRIYVKDKDSLTLWTIE